MFLRPLIFFVFLSLGAYAKPLKIVALGDSVTAGYGVAKKSAYPYLLEQLLKKKRPNVRVVNAGISGATTASALPNLKWQLRAKVDILILCLGGNDGLRGLKLEKSEENLSKAITMAKKKGIKVLLVGMKIPENYGKKYRSQFEEMYPKLAKKHGVPLMPFLLKDVGAVKELNLADGIHPNEEGYKKVAENVLPYIEKLL